MPRSHMIVTHSEYDKVIRTPDKAAHGAATENFAYFLRGLLAVPRFEDDEDMNAEAGVTENFPTPQPVTTGGTQPEPKDPKPPKAADELPPIVSNKVSFMTDERTADLRTMIIKTESNEAKLIKYYKVSSIAFLTELQHTHLMQVLNLKLDASNIARETGGKVTKLNVTTPPTGTVTEATPIVEGVDETLNEAQVELLLKSLTAKKKKVGDLLAHFAYADVFDFPVNMFNEVMAWVRK